MNSRFTDLFIKRPVLATVISLLILIIGLHTIGSGLIMKPWQDRSMSEKTLVQSLNQ